MQDVAEEVKLGDRSFPLCLPSLFLMWIHEYTEMLLSLKSNYTFCMLYLIVL